MRNAKGSFVMANLLIIHHTPSPPAHELLQAVTAGANNDQIANVSVALKPALSVSASDVLAADGYLLGTPANFGYMSGALKHAFDNFYYQVLDETVGRPYGLWVYGNNETSGAVRSVTTIAKGLGWKQVAKPLEVVAPPDGKDIDAAWELGAIVAATLTT